MVQELITDLPRALSWAGVVAIAAMILPRLLREIPEIIRARAMSRLCKALTDQKDGWSAETQQQVVRAVVELGRQPAESTAVGEEPGASDPPADGQPDRSSVP